MCEYMCVCLCMCMCVKCTHVAVCCRYKTSVEKQIAAVSKIQEVFNKACQSHEKVQTVWVYIKGS